MTVSLGRRDRAHELRPRGSETAASAPIALRAYRRLIRLLPLAGGATALTYNPLARRLFRDCSGCLRATLLNGVAIDIDPRDFDGRILYLFGTNDKKVQAAVCALLRPGDCFLDIGANHASIGIHAADVVGPGGAVHLFEPQSGLCDRIAAALERAGYENVRLHRLGLLDRQGRMTLAHPAWQSGMGTLDDARHRGTWPTETVRVEPIDRYVPPLIAGRRFGVKLDVEGVEHKLIPWLVAQPGMTFLLFEAAHNRSQLWDDVRAGGLVVYGLVRRVVGYRLRRVRDVDQMARYHDVIAVRACESDALPDVATPAALAARLEGRT